MKNTIIAIGNFFIYWAYRIYYFLDIKFKFKIIFYDKSNPLPINDLYAYYSAFKIFSKAHNDVNQKYDKKYPYAYHLRIVADYAIRFSYLLDRIERNYSIIGTFGHDGIEDARLTWNDIAKMFGNVIADIIYRCTNEKGKTRKDRANDKFYRELMEDDIATYVKICDRAGNFYHSKKTGSDMYFKYQRE